MWDALTGQLINTFQGHIDIVTSVKYSPDGTRIVSGANDNTVKVWNAETGALLNTLQVTSVVNAVAYSPDGTKIVSGSDDQNVKVWDAETGALLNTLEGHTRLVNSVGYRPDGTRIVSGSSDNTIKVWDAETGALLNTIEGHSRYVLAVAYSPDGTKIVSGSGDNTIKVWSDTSKQNKLLPIGTVAMVCDNVKIRLPDDVRPLISAFLQGQMPLETLEWTKKFLTRQNLWITGIKNFRNMNTVGLEITNIEPGFSSNPTRLNIGFVGKSPNHPANALIGANEGGQSSTCNMVALKLAKQIGHLDPDTLIIKNVEKSGENKLLVTFTIGLQRSDTINDSRIEELDMNEEIIENGESGGGGSGESEISAAIRRGRKSFKCTGIECNILGGRKSRKGKKSRKEKKSRKGRKSRKNKKSRKK